ncbi:MAG: cytochrome c biogenesis protein CcsA [Verrucomicrobiales bacterium]
MDRLYLAISCAFFLAGILYAVLALTSGRYRQSSWNLLAIAGGFIFQTAFLYARGQVHGRCPISNLSEILIFLAWAMTIIYFLFGPTYRLSLLGLFTSPLVFLLQLPGLIAPFDREAALARAAGRSIEPWTELHVSVALLAYGAFAMACVAGVMFLVQERQIQKRKLNALFYNLPPINTLTKTILRLLGLGLVLLIVAIGSAYKIPGGTGGHSIAPLYIILAAYSLLLGISVTRGIAPRRLASLAVVAFAFPIISLWMLSPSH